MNYAQRELFLITLKQQFSDIFTTSKAGKDTAELRFRAQGFVHAGELLQLCSRDEIKQLMDQVHKEIFGINVAERKPKEYDRRQQALKLGDYDYFDEPAFNRLR
jgi:hypothetical protein